MPSLANHQSNDYVKLLLLGDAKSRKTSSLAALVNVGYKLNILDFDNLLDVLKGIILDRCPDKIGNVEFRTLRDKYKAGASGSMLDGKPKAWLDSLKMLNEWRYTEDGVETNLGKPWEWPKDTILVIDSLSRWCDAAYDFHEVMAGPGMDGRAVYGNAQDDVEKQIASITAKNMTCHIIVIAHGVYLDQDDGSTKIFPQGVGNKLSPKIPQYFPNYIRYKNQGGKCTIQMKSDAMINLANSRPLVMKESYDIEDGLAEIFQTLVGDPPGKVEEKPKLQLKRV